MKKNIILIDIFGNYIESALKTGKYNIKLAILEGSVFVDMCKKRFGNNVENYYHRTPTTNTEFKKMNESDYNLTYEEIENFRPTQLKAEHFLHRELNDDASIQDRYYTALRFFLGFFEKNKIDMVFAAHVEHGAIWDSLIIDIARSKNIPVYIVSVASSNRVTQINCLTEIKQGQRILCDVSTIDCDRDLNNYHNNLTKYLSNMKKGSSIKDSCIKNIKKWISRFKYIGLNIYETFFKFNKEYRKLDNKFIHQCTFYQKELTEKEIYVKNLKKFYDKLAIKPDYKNENYILYPLHQDPEATTMIRTPMSCQLHIIELISKYLPDGWTLYVKEHPSEFYAYDLAPYFYKNIDYFRSFEVYKRIKKLKNVKLISLDIPTKDLIEHSKAVTSITGSIFMEAIEANKPIIVWGYLSTFVEKLKSAFCITSTNDLKESIEEISKGFVPDYSDFNDVLNKYTYFVHGYGTMYLEKENPIYTGLLELIYKL